MHLGVKMYTAVNWPCAVKLAKQTLLAVWHTDFRHGDRMSELVIN